MARNRTIFLTAAVAACVLAGCQQHFFMTEGDFKHYREKALAPPAPTIGDIPESATAFYDGPVRTVDNPDAPRREISLAECICIALENGRTGDFFDRAGSGRFSSLAGLIGAGRGSPSNVTDAIRVFAFDPAIVGTEIEQSLSKFDARLFSSMTWARTDEPRNVLFGLRGINTTEEESANFQTQLLKPLPTGGLAGITYRTRYAFSNINERFGAFNPEYIPVMEFTFEQPLLQGAGVGINQLRTQHPGGILTPLPTGGRVPGILLTRIAYDQSQVEFERRVHDILFAVEQAYWELYCAYWDYYSRETALRQAQATWQIAKVRFDVGKISGQELAQIEEQYHAFRAQRLAALGSGLGRPGVLEAERRLRYLVGLPPEDGCRLVPSDTPTVAPFNPDWCTALRQALANRPELIQIRQDIQAANLAVLREKDFLLPDLRFLARYNINALGSRLDGTDERNALRNLLENEFNNWEMGLRLDMPLGYREANSEVRRARLQLAQRLALLQDEETKVNFSLQKSYRDIFQRYDEIRINRARRLAASDQLRLRYQEFQAGRGTIDILLEAQRNWADALREEHFAICDYNVALIDFERQKGTIMMHDNVVISEGPLPACAMARASEHIRDRARSILVKDPHQNCWPGSQGEPGTSLPDLDVPETAPIPQLLDKQKDAPSPEVLPSPRKVPVEPAPKSQQEPADRTPKVDVVPASGSEAPRILDLPDGPDLSNPAELPKKLPILEK